MNTNIYIYIYVYIYIYIYIHTCFWVRYPERAHKNARNSLSVNQRGGAPPTQLPRQTKQHRLLGGYFFT